MSQILWKVDRLTVKDFEDAPEGKWTDRVIDSIGDLVEVVNQIRAIGLQSRVGTTMRTVSLSTVDDWVPLVMDNKDWKPVPSTGHPTPAVRKYDDGTAELRGGLFYSKVIPSLYISTCPYTWMYPDSLMPFLALNPSAGAVYRGTVNKNGSIFLETSPAIADYILIQGHWRWQCADPNPPPHLSAPVVVGHDLSSLGDMRIVSCEDATIPGVPVPHPRLAWMDAGNGTVKITNVLGLPGGKKYILKLLFIEG